MLVIYARGESEINGRRTGPFLLCIFLVILIISPAYAQVEQKRHSGAGMGSGIIQGYDFAQYDSRFDGFGAMTFKEVSDIFGVPVEDAVYDLELPKDLNTQLTVMEIEEFYGVSGREIASYMVMNMQELDESLTLSEKLLMRQQAIHEIRAGKGKGMFFMRQGNFACGSFTTFNFNNSGVIKSFAVGGNLLFDSIGISNFEYLDERITETTAFYQDIDSQILIQDSPMGVFQVRAFENKTITFNLADGVKASPVENTSSIPEITAPIKIAANNFEAYLVFFRNPCAEDPEKPVNGTSAEILEDRITVRLVEDSAVTFRAIPMQPILMQTEYSYDHDYACMQQLLNREIATGRFAAEVAFREGSDQASVTNYAPVNLRVRDRDQDRIVLCLDSELPDGRVIGVNIDNETINLTGPEHLRIRYDGKVVEETDSIDELFNGGNRPLCYILKGNGIASIAVYVPEVSKQIIIDLAPESGKDVAGMLEIKKAALSGSETSGIREGTTGNEGEIADTGKSKAQNEEDETESSPAFELGFTIAGIVAAYGLKRRK